MEKSNFHFQKLICASKNNSILEPTKREVFKLLLSDVYKLVKIYEILRINVIDEKQYYS